MSNFRWNDKIRHWEEIPEELIGSPVADRFDLDIQEVLNTKARQKIQEQEDRIAIGSLSEWQNLKKQDKLKKGACLTVRPDGTLWSWGINDVERKTL